MNRDSITEILHTGDHCKASNLRPESPPIYATTAFIWNSLYEAKAAYATMEKSGDNYTYIRTCNPNRDMLAEVVSYLEAGEKSLICSSGMGAICPSVLALVQAGDHIVYSNCCYGETLELMQKVFTKFGVESTAVPINDLEKVEAAMQPNTKLILTEVVANPCMIVADIPALVKLAHDHGAKILVDNTFTTPMAIKPLTMGADIVVNSLTKFLNGHSDAVLGAVTTSHELAKDIRFMSMVSGTPSDPNSAWLVNRSMKTADLRIPLQMSNAYELAVALEACPHVLKVYHPALASFEGNETAKRIFKDERSMCAMLSIMLPEGDMDKLNEFTEKLTIATYAPTLGGVRTTYQNPCTSSHSHTPQDQKDALGISDGLFRISVGTESARDIINDFLEALKVFD